MAARSSGQMNGNFQGPPGDLSMHFCGTYISLGVRTFPSVIMATKTDFLSQTLVLY